MQQWEEGDIGAGFVCRRAAFSDAGHQHRRASPLKDDQLTLYGEIIAVCSQIHTKHINTLCGQNVEFFNFKLAVHIATTGL